MNPVPINALTGLDNLGENVFDPTGYEHPTRPTSAERIIFAKGSIFICEWVSTDSSTGIKGQLIFSDNIDDTSASNVDEFFEILSNVVYGIRRRSDFQ